jgi:hypothetical protein
MTWNVLWYQIQTAPPPLPTAGSGSLLPANAVIVFQRPLESATLGDFGPAAEAEPLVVIAFLKLVGVPLFNPDPTTNRSTSIAKGYLINPPLMPFEIQPQQNGRCSFWRVGMGDGFNLPQSFADLAAYDAFALANASRLSNVGTLTLDNNIPGPFGVEAILGDRIRGTFVAETAWTDEL